MTNFALGILGGLLVGACMLVLLVGWMAPDRRPGRPTGGPGQQVAAIDRLPRPRVAPEPVAEQAGAATGTGGGTSRRAASAARDVRGDA